MTNRRQRSLMSVTSRTASSCGALLLTSSLCTGFTLNTPPKRSPSPLHVYAPPGSGYLGRDPKKTNTVGPNSLTEEQIDQISPPNYPDTYEPMMEYPGTMRPGKTPENMPYHDLPGLDVSDPDPVPWPHFQEIEWHHHWDPPEDAFPLMEDFIEMEGRWASVEEEAEMRMGMRRGVRERREMEESAAAGDAMVIMDDDEEDEGVMGDVPAMMGLGDGVEALIGKSKLESKKSKKAADIEEEEDEDDESFLFDLGLGDDDDEEDVKPKSKKGKSNVKASAVEEDDDEDLPMDDDDDDLSFDLGFDLDDVDLDDDGDEEGDGDDDMYDFDDDDDDISIDDLNAKDEGGDDDEFDDGGFDYDD